jgi:hypothetical protein
MNAPILRKGARAEQLGQELAADTLAAMREPGSDSAAAFLLAEALRDLAELPRCDRACEGFAAELAHPLRYSAPAPATDNAHCFDVQAEFWTGPEGWAYDSLTAIESYSTHLEHLSQAPPVRVLVLPGCTPEQAAGLLRELAETLEAKGFRMPPLRTHEARNFADECEVPF